MSAQSLAFSDQFTRANTYPGAASSTTALGANFIDQHGGVGSIVANSLAMTDDGIDGNTFNRDSVTLPSSLNAADQRLVGYTTTNAKYGKTVQIVTYSYQLAYQSVNTAYLFQLIWHTDTNAMQGGVYRQNAGAISGLGFTSSFTCNPAHVYSIDCRVGPVVSGARPITCIVTDVTAGGSVSFTYSDTSPLATGGYAVTCGTSGGITAYHSRIDIFANPSAVNGVITQTANSPAVLSLAVAASGGTGSGYTYQWYKSTTSGFTPSSGTAIAGATASTLTDTAPIGTTYYVCVVTDSASNSNPSNQFVAAPYAAALNLLFIGTSVNAYTPPDGTLSPPMAAAKAIVAATGLRTITVVNSAVAGSASGQWTAGSSFLNTAIAAGQAAGCTAAYIEMGPNDAAEGVTATAFGANMSSMLGALKTAGITPIVGYPNYAQPLAVPFNNPAAQYPSTVPAALASYLPIIDGLIDGSTVLRGATANFAYSAEHPEEQLDGIHPNCRGVDSLGSFEGIAICKALKLLAAPINVAAGVVNGDTVGTLAVDTGTLVLFGTGVSENVSIIDQPVNIS